MEKAKRAGETNKAKKRATAEEVKDADANQAKKRERTEEEAHRADEKKVKMEKEDTGDGDGSESWHWVSVMKGSEHVGEDGVVDLEKFSEAQVRHGPQVQQ